MKERPLPLPSGGLQRAGGGGDSAGKGADRRMTGLKRVPPAGTRTLKRGSVFRGYLENYQLVLMFLPVVILLLLLCYAPMGGIVIAFKDYKLSKGIWGSEWVGFKNFAKLFSMPSFLEVLRNTFVISGLKILFGFPAPILLAILLNELSFPRFKKIAQTVSYLPHFLSWVILSGVFLQVLSPSGGLVNNLVVSLGHTPIYFLGDPDYFVGTLVVTHVWKEIGWSSVIYLASLTAISPELYEAATVDGASRLQRILHITLPSLLPTITIMFIMETGQLINAGFDQVFNLYNEAVYKVADIIDTYVYRRGLIDMQYSFSVTAGLFKNVVSFVLVMFANQIAKWLGGSTIW